MDRDTFHRLFKTPGPAVLPVIHAASEAQTLGNIEIAVEAGVQGVFLINHDFAIPEFLPMVRAARAAHPRLWMGVNFLGVTGREAFPVLAGLEDEGVAVDACWADDACIDERAETQAEAGEIARIRSQCGWRGLYFGGTAFKKQRPVAPDRYGDAARIAAGFMDVVTTSGMATGEAAGHDKVADFRRGCGAAPLAIASGVTPENARDYAAFADAFLVATGINHAGDFYNIDPARLGRLVEICRKAGAGGLGGAAATGDDRGDRWYLRMMAPNIRGEKFAWLDPSAMYVNARVFHALIDDLAAPFHADGIDVVAAMDAAGFVLGAALATRLGKGLLTIRKAGKLPVDTDSVEFVNYTGRTQELEIRTPAIRPGARVLIVDQWIETGGTMDGAIRLIEGQGGTVAGIACVCIEETPAGVEIRRKYKCATAVMPGTDFQAQCNAKYLDFFDGFDWRSILPDSPERASA